MTNERDDTLPIQVDGSLSIADMATLLAERVEYLEAADLERHAPTQGRVAKETTSREFHVGDGSQWHPASEFITGSFESLSTERINTTYHAAGYDGADGGAKIQAALDDAHAATGHNAVTVGANGPDTNGEWYIDGLTIGEETTLLLDNAHLFLKDGANSRCITNKDHTNRTTGIRILGLGDATVDGNAANQTSSNQNRLGIQLVRVDNYRVEGIRAGPYAGWGITAEDTTGGVFRDIELLQDGSKSNQDGIHLITGAQNITIEDIRGTAHDDFISIITHGQADSMSVWPDTAGDAVDININNIYGVAAGSAKGLVNFGVGDGGLCRDIVMSNLYLRTGSSDLAHAINFGGGPFVESRNGTLPTTDEFTRITASNVVCEDANGQKLIQLENNIGEITLCGLTSHGNSFQLLNQSGGSGYTAETVTVDGFSFTNTGSAANVFVVQDTINRLVVRGGTLGSINRFLYDGGSGGGTINAGRVQDIHVEDISGGAFLGHPGTANITLKDVTIESGNLFGNIPSGVKFEGGLPPMDVTAVPVVEGARAYNNGTTGTAGPAFCDGTNWVSLVDGTTIV